MSIIKKQDFIDSIADALQYISYYHPLDFVQAAKAAYDREANPAARQLLRFLQEPEARAVIQAFGYPLAD